MSRGDESDQEWQKTLVTGALSGSAHDSCSSIIRIQIRNACSNRARDFRVLKIDSKLQTASNRWLCGMHASHLLAFVNPSERTRSSECQGEGMNAGLDSTPWPYAASVWNIARQGSSYKIRT